MKAGNIELVYDEGRVRYIKYKGRELLRMIYPALRDKDWKTIKGKMENENIDSDENGFTISYQLVYSAPEINYKAEFEISCRNDTLTYIMRGEALSSFKSKRVGLCVHHPIPPCAGRKVTISHPGGKTKDYIFPELITPDTPFTDIVSMKWQTTNADINLEFEGDLFETEDQRNWTDDSYKTYSGPQYKTPMLDIKKGDKMTHKVTMRVRDSETVENEKNDKPLKFTFPKIGYSRSAGQQELSTKEIELIKQLPFDHYRVELHINNKDWENEFRKARREAKLFNAKIELAVHIKSAEESDKLIEEIKDTADIDSILVFAEKIFKDTRDKLKKAFPGIKTGFGTEGWFADLNSALPIDEPHDFVSFLVSPQVHQDDNLSILENLGSQHTTIETLRSKIGDAEIHLSPILFHHNADDERLHTSLGAWWTINAICNFAGAGYLTIYELKGPRGIINNEANLSPLFNLLKTIKDSAPQYILKEKKDEIVIENKNRDQITFHKKSFT